MNPENRRRFQSALNILGPFLGLAFVIGLFAAMPEVRERFLMAGNIKSVAAQSVIVALGALGMTLVIISGGIDLSASSSWPFSATDAP